MARMREGASTDDYRKALSGEGDTWSLGYEWSDKPHRLVYDLCGEIDALRVDVLRAIRSDREATARLIETTFCEARDTEFDRGFEAARKVFAALARRERE